MLLNETGLLPQTQSLSRKAFYTFAATFARQSSSACATEACLGVQRIRLAPHSVTRAALTCNARRAAVISSRFRHISAPVLELIESGTR
jgi:hypothetical protein